MGDQVTELQKLVRCTLTHATRRHFTEQLGIDADVVDPGTRYRVVARDPFGRRGPPSPETST